MTKLEDTTPSLLGSHLPPYLSTDPVGFHMVQPEGLPRALIHHVELVPVSHADEVVTLFRWPIYQGHHRGRVGQTDLLCGGQGWGRKG